MESQQANEPEELTHFSTTKGKRMRTSEMATPHIRNAIKKLEAKLDTMVKDLEALRTELRFRKFERKL